MALEKQKQLVQLNEITITQTGHGFIVDDYLIYDKGSSQWVRANASGNISGSVGSVKSVIDGNTFVLKAFGSIVDYTGTAGDYYYVDENGTGLLTNTQPLNRVQEALFAIPSNKAIVVNWHTQINLQNTVYVTFNGNDTTGNGSITKPYKSIQVAINNSQPNSTVIIDTGAYTENITITNGIHLKASSYRSVYINGKVIVNQTITNNPVSFEGINFLNSTDHVFEYSSTNGHEVTLYECAITQGGAGAFHALYVTATNGNFLGKYLQTSTSISTGGSRAIYTSNTANINFTLFDCLTGVEDNPDNIAIELNGTNGFIYVGKNISGQTVAQGDGLVLMSFGGISTNTVPVLVTTIEDETRFNALKPTECMDETFTVKPDYSKSVVYDTTTKAILSVPKGQSLPTNGTTETPTYQDDVFVNGKWTLSTDRLKQNQIVLINKKYIDKLEQGIVFSGIFTLNDKSEILNPIFQYDEISQDRLFKYKDIEDVNYWRTLDNKNVILNNAQKNALYTLLITEWATDFNNRINEIGAL